MVVAIERLIPSTTKRNIAVIGDTTWALDTQPGLNAASQAIPFWGFLMGFAFVGHSVWVFDGTADRLKAGCRDADVLIVDCASLGGLPSDWQPEAARSMRNPEILVHDRSSFKLLRYSAN
jgi:hypothetical protein